jgi:hypothetical protein
MTMNDSFGDGWNGATYDITVDGVSVASGDIDSAQTGDGSSFGTDAIGIGGSCGCTDSTACNYDSTADVDNGSCLFDDVCGVCGGSGTVAGCTDSTACNYDSTADCDDGSCLFDDECGNCGGSDTAGCNDSTACNYDSTASCDDGSCCYENCITLDMNDSFGDGWNGATYEITLDGVSVATGDIDSAQSGDGSSFGTDVLCLADGCYEITVAGGTFESEITWTLNGVDGGSVSGAAPETASFDVGCAISGCTDSTACNYDSTATTDDGSCVLPNGCTDSAACNYDSTATCDDGSCVLPNGCTDSTACNYDSTATCDDGSCVLPNGCTDSTACNYDSTATCDDGSCVLPNGCTDSTACNYDSTATCDDGSCEFASCACPGDFNESGTIGIFDLLYLLAEFGCTSGCTADLTGDGEVNSQDLLAFLPLFGTSCP